MSHPADPLSFPNSRKFTLPKRNVQRNETKTSPASGHLVEVYETKVFNQVVVVLRPHKNDDGTVRWNVVQLGWICFRFHFGCTISGVLSEPYPLLSGDQCWI